MLLAGGLCAGASCCWRPRLHKCRLAPKRLAKECRLQPLLPLKHGQLPLSAHEGRVACAAGSSAPSTLLPSSAWLAAGCPHHAPHPSTMLVGAGRGRGGRAREVCSQAGALAKRGCRRAPHLGSLTSVPGACSTAKQVPAQRALFCTQSLLRERAQGSQRRGRRQLLTSTRGGQRGRSRQHLPLPPPPCAWLLCLGQRGASHERRGGMGSPWGAGWLAGS